MDKLKMHSINKVDENIEKIGKLFPNCITERKNEKGEVEYAIDFDMLKQELSTVVVEGNEERYQFTWPDKKKSILLANAPIAKTLRPCREESVDFDNTENLYIEGDNLDVLKLLQETYLGKIKMIYIDPPYNTGNDFVYNDDFAESADEYLANSGQFDEDGNRLVYNTENNGRFHTDWLNMIYTRIKLSKSLLSEDGVLFISIGQDEGYNLIKCCNEIFGEENRVGVISRMMKSGGNKGQYFSPNIEYVLVYAKSLLNLGYFREALSEDIIKTYNHTEKDGEKAGQKYTIKGLCQPGLGNRPNQRYWIEAPDGSFVIPRGKNFPSTIADGEKILPTDDDTCWKWTYDRYKEEKAKGNILFQKSTSATALVDEKGETAKWNVFNKIWLEDRLDEGRVPVDLITKWENRISSNELKSLNIPFDFAKPTELIKYLLSLVSENKNAIVLDFFSGSATTAHSVMQMNAEDGGNRKFIMVQLPEETDEKSEAYKSGYKNICEIGKERIRRAGAKIKEQLSQVGSCYRQMVDIQNKMGLVEENVQVSIIEENTPPENDGYYVVVSEKEDTRTKSKNEKIANSLDTGFRVLKLDSTNMKDVYYNPAEYELSLFDNLADNIKEDRTPEDLLFQVMLDLGILLSSKIEESTVGGKKVFNVADGFLYACFDNNVTEDVITEIAKKTPYYFVMRDSSMANDSVATNFEQIFATYSPDTVRKVL